MSILEGKTIQEKFEYLEEETSIIEFLEETNKCNVSDMEVEDIDEVVEVLEHGGYIVDNNYEVLTLLNKEELREARINEYTRKLYKNKGGAGGYTYKINIPVELIRELDAENAEELELRYNYNEECVELRLKDS